MCILLRVLFTSLQVLNTYYICGHRVVRTALNLVTVEGFRRECDQNLVMAEERDVSIGHTTESTVSK